MYLPTYLLKHGWHIDKVQYLYASNLVYLYFAERTKSCLFKYSKHTYKRFSFTSLFKNKLKYGSENPYAFNWFKNTRYRMRTRVLKR